MRRYATLFLGLGLATITFPVLAGGGWTWVLAWLGAGLTAIGVAYGAAFPGVFGKQSNGSMAVLNLALFAPYLVLTWVTWHVVRVFSRESPFDRLEGLILARRLLSNEVPDDAAIVVDLTAEFAEPSTMMQGRTYHAVPILDGGIPRLELLKSFIVALPSSRTILIHCAQGHGRTAMVAACTLLERGLVPSADAAVARILSARPGARMNRAQHAFVKSYARTLSST
jgi:protein-tyrosine phosphatase